MLEIVQIPVLKDNYVYLLREPAAGTVGVVDPAVADAVEAELDRRGWRLTHVINTHHHGDHVGGNLRLKERYGATIVGPRADRQRIPGINVEVGEGDDYLFGREKARVFDVPGHTRGHIAYWFKDSHALFCGDTIFSLGCGRLFEGTAQQMWTSLGKLRALPDDTRVYCAHEYTESNARFAVTVDPGNPDLARRVAEVKRLRAEGKPTVPSTMGEERRANPFLRADQPGVAAGVALDPRDPVAVFAEVRRRKDAF
ncbi:MAG: hydroxyacylglutathione hydrolase [Alphaproteobacteria bacterium]|nr:hydroxyacylglutathione hydrolase [Alphaproteobacteria bacterium]